VVCEGESVKFVFIAEMGEENDRKPRDERFPVMFMCEMLEVSRQGYYAWKKRVPSARTRKDVTLTTLIVAIHDMHKGRYGIDRIHAELARSGYCVSPKRVRRLARAAGLRCVHPRPYRATTVQDPANSDGLVDLVGRNFVPGAKDQLWYGDITYIFTMDDWAYLATVIDGYSRKVVGWAVADHMREELVIDALVMAVANRNPGTGEVVFHSDRGSQYTGGSFRDTCLNNGIIPSVGKTGICYDNAAAESWNATFKKELIHLHVWENVAHVRQASFEFVEVYYNRQRIQKELGYLTPSEYELEVDKVMVNMA
jgi:transposase InsO family protein